MDKENRWRQSIYTKMAQEEAVTYLPAGKQTTTPPEDQPNYDVYALELQKKKDKGKPLIIYGNEITIPTQISLLKALDMWAEYRGINLTFEDFWKYWEEGFSFAINRTGTPALITNYPIKDRTNPDGTITPGFRKDRDVRPGYLEFKNPNIKNNPLFRTIEYWPDRSIKSKSYLLLGSDRDIINQIIQLEYEGGAGSAAQTINEPKFTAEKSFRGFPKINIWFYESIETRDPNYLPMRGKLSFRIPGKTERYDLVNSGQTDLEKLTTADVKVIADRIFQQFGQPTPHRWHKGKESFSYKDKLNGVQTWGHCYAKSDGLELINKLMAVIGKPVQLKKFHHITVEDSTNAFPANPPDENIMGEITKGSRLRPSGFVYFHGATLHLESLFAEVSLCDSKGVTFSEEKFKDRGATGFW